jgi:glycosyltransferase involved in cell wall biosynthesis
MLTGLKTILYAIYFVRDRGRLKHMALADVIIVESPEAGKRLVKLLDFYKKYKALQKKIHFIPSPVSPVMRCSNIGVSREKKIVSVAGWGRHKKNAPLLIESLGEVLEIRKDYSAILIGSGKDYLYSFVRKLSKDVQSRVEIKGVMPYEHLPEVYSKNKIFFLPSWHESIPLVAEEALSCGMSIVSINSPTLPFLRYAVDRDSGTLAKSYKKKDVVGTLN